MSSTKSPRFQCPRQARAVEANNNFPPDNSLGGRLLSLNGALIGVVAATVIMRIYVRAVIVQSFKVDDSLMVAALICGIGVFVCWKGEVDSGLGHHIVYIPPGQFSAILHWQFFQTLINLVGTSLVKLSICFLLERLVTSSNLKRLIWCTIVFITAFTFSYAGTHVFGCIPPSAAWDTSLRMDSDTRCFSRQTMLAVHTLHTTINIITNLFLITLSIPIIWRFNLAKRYRFSFFAIVGLGTFACAASVIKLSYLLKAEQTLDVFRDSSLELWSSIELYTVTMAASLPYLWAMFENDAEKLTRTRKLYRQSFHRRHTTTTTTTREDGPEKEIEASLIHPLERTYNQPNRTQPSPYPTILKSLLPKRTASANHSTTSTRHSRRRLHKPPYLAPAHSHSVSTLERLSRTTAPPLPPPPAPPNEQSSGQRSPMYGYHAMLLRSKGNLPEAIQRYLQRSSIYADTERNEEEWDDTEQGQLLAAQDTAPEATRVTQGYTLLHDVRYPILRPPPVHCGPLSAETDGVFLTPGMTSAWRNGVGTSRQMDRHVGTRAQPLSPNLRQPPNPPHNQSSTRPPDQNTTAQSPTHSRTNHQGRVPPKPAPAIQQRHEVYQQPGVLQQQSGAEQQLPISAPPLSPLARVASDTSRRPASAFVPGRLAGRSWSYPPAMRAGLGDAGGHGYGLDQGGEYGQDYGYEYAHTYNSGYNGASSKHAHELSDQKRDVYGVGDMHTDTYPRRDRGVYTGRYAAGRQELGRPGLDEDVDDAGSTLTLGFDVWERV